MIMVFSPGLFPRRQLAATADGGRVVVGGARLAAGAGGAASQPDPLAHCTNWGKASLSNCLPVFLLSYCWVNYLNKI